MNTKPNGLPVRDAEFIARVKEHGDAAIYEGAVIEDRSVSSMMFDLHWSRQEVIDAFNREEEHVRMQDAGPYTMDVYRRMVAQIEAQNAADRAHN